MHFSDLLYFLITIYIHSHSVSPAIRVTRNVGERLDCPVGQDKLPSRPRATLRIRGFEASGFGLPNSGDVRALELDRLVASQQVLLGLGAKRTRRLVVPGREVVHVGGSGIAVVVVGEYYRVVELSGEARCRGQAGGTTANDDNVVKGGDGHDGSIDLGELTVFRGVWALGVRMDVGWLRQNEAV